MTRETKQVWFRADIPPAYRTMIKLLATAKLGGMPFYQGKLKNGSGWTNNGKWMFKKGNFYFRSQAIASEFEQSVTFYELQKSR